jgi:hypothetical protein
MLVLPRTSCLYIGLQSIYVTIKMDLTLCNGLEFSVVIAQNLVSAAKMYPWMRNVLIKCVVFISVLST